MAALRGAGGSAAISKCLGAAAKEEQQDEDLGP